MRPELDDMPVREAELHAYVDGELSAHRRAAVESYLAKNPEAVTRVDDYRSLNILLHRAFDSSLEEPLSAALRESKNRLMWSEYRRQVRRRTAGWALATAVLMLLLSAGWIGRGWLAPAESTTVADNHSSAVVRLAADGQRVAGAPPLRSEIRASH